MSNDINAASAAPASSPQSKKTIKDLEAEITKLQETAEFISAQKPQTHPVSQGSQFQVRDCIYAQLHNEVFLPSLGQLPKSMDCSAGSQQPKLRGLEMKATEIGLEVTLRGRTGFNPWGNVAWAVFKTLTKAEAKEADKDAGANSVVPGYSGPTKLGTATVTAK